MAFAVVCMVGLLFGSRALISIGTVGIIATAVLGTDLKAGFRAFLSNKAAVFLSSLFLLTVLSGIVSENTSTWLEYVRIKLSVLLLPFAFVSIPRLSTRQFHSLIYVFVLLTSLSFSWVLGDYLLNFEEINQRIGQGKSLNTPVIYVRYSLFIAFACLAAIYLFLEDFFWKFKWEKYLIGFIALFLFGAVHLLAVRSGILGLYVAFTFWSVYFILKKQKYGLGAGLLLIVFLAPFLSYKFVPSFKKKIDYMLYDLDQFRKGDKTQMPSDFVRLVTLQLGFEVFQESPVMGSGIGDLRDEMNKLYARDYPMLDKPRWYLPHNQFMFVLTAYGVVGLLWFLLALFWPILQNGGYRHLLFLGFYAIILTSFMAEASAELQIGHSFFLLFTLLFVREMEVIGNQQSAIG